MILLFGPTGVGKTDLLDSLFPGAGEVVSADALQVYRDLDIGTAKPSSDLQSRLPHHLIDIIDFAEPFSVGGFCRLADLAVREILGRGLIPVISGGTAYYLKSWYLGLPSTPVAGAKLRERLEAEWKGRPDEDLAEDLAKVDPVSASRIALRDRYRMIRALEVFAASGRPLSSFPVPGTPRTDYEVLSVGLRRERSNLADRIEQRVDLMLEAGLQDEVEKLRNQGARASDPGMKAIGYREWFPDSQGVEPGLDQVREHIIRNTRRYAKRQMTFFSSLPDVRWFDMERPEGSVGVESELQAFIDRHG